MIRALRRLFARGDAADSTRELRKALDRSVEALTRAVAQLEANAIAMDTAALRLAVAHSIIERTDFALERLPGQGGLLGMDVRDWLRRNPAPEAVADRPEEKRTTIRDEAEQDVERAHRAGVYSQFRTSLDGPWGRR